MAIATGKNILRGGNNAGSKFGFSGNHGSPITAAPKWTDQYFVEFRTPNGVIDYSSSVKRVSNIDIMTEYLPIDQYGKRIQVPTRVSFPEVTLDLYDVVNGKTFRLARQIYENYFKNNRINTSEGAMSAAVTDNNSGIKFTQSTTQQFHYFSKITIFHFFGSTGSSGNGYLQKIELINPLVTAISFSESDYSSNDIRTVTLTVAPENVIIKDSKTDIGTVASPKWMSLGMEYIEEYLRNNFTSSGMAGDASDVQEIEDYINKLIGAGSQAVGAGMVVDPNVERQVDEIYSKTSYGAITGSENAAIAARNALLTGIGPISRTQSEAETLNREENTLVLNQLARLYNLTRISSDPATAKAQLQAAQSAAMPIQGSAIARSVEYVPNSTLYGTVPDFTNLGSSAVGDDRFTGSDLMNAIKSELVNSFFNGTSFSLKNIGESAAQQILGNTGMGNVMFANQTASSEYGIAGDIIRDNLLQAGTSYAPSNNTVYRSVTTIPSDRDTTQGTVDSLRNLTRGIR